MTPEELAQCLSCFSTGGGLRPLIPPGNPGGGTPSLLGGVRAGCSHQEVMDTHFVYVQAYGVRGCGEGFCTGHRLHPLLQGGFASTWERMSPTFDEGGFPWTPGRDARRRRNGRGSAQGGAGSGTVQGNGSPPHGATVPPWPGNTPGNQTVRAQRRANG